MNGPREQSPKELAAEEYAEQQNIDSGLEASIPVDFDPELSENVEEEAAAAAKESFKAMGNEEPTDEELEAYTKEISTPMEEVKDEEVKWNWKSEFTEADAIKELSEFSDGTPTQEMIDDWLAEVN